MAEATEHVDVLIIGAGLSGIGAAAHLVRECPGKQYAVLESRGAIGGTWDLFRYPGIRSDSDMYTFGYAFKPWTEPKAISDGASIKRYVEETADEYGITDHIRFHHRVLSARVVHGRGTLDGDRRADRHRGNRRHHRLVGHRCHRLLPLRRGLPTGVRRARSASAGRSCTPSTGPRISTTRASAWLSSAAVPRP